MRAPIVSILSRKGQRIPGAGTVHLHYAMAVAVSIALVGSPAFGQSAMSQAGVQLSPSQNSGEVKITDAKLLDSRLAVRVPCDLDSVKYKTAPSLVDAPRKVDRIAAILCERPDLAQFGLVVTDFSDSAAARENYNEALTAIAGTATDGSLSYKGRESRDFVMHNDRTCGWTRAILDGRRLLLLLGERLEGACGTIESESRSFFDSLEFSAQ